MPSKTIPLWQRKLRPDQEPILPEEHPSRWPITYEEYAEKLEHPQENGFLEKPLRRITRKVILDEIEKHQVWWRGSIKNLYHKMAHKVYRRTGELLKPETIRQYFTQAKKELRTWLREAIIKEKLSPRETEEYLWKNMEMYVHIRFYRSELHQSEIEWRQQINVEGNQPEKSKNQKSEKLRKQGKVRYTESVGEEVDETDDDSDRIAQKMEGSKIEKVPKTQRKYEKDDDWDYKSSDNSDSEDDQGRAKNKGKMYVIKKSNGVSSRTKMAEKEELFLRNDGSTVHQSIAHHFSRSLVAQFLKKPSSDNSSIAIAHKNMKSNDQKLPQQESRRVIPVLPATSFVFEKAKMEDLNYKKSEPRSIVPLTTKTALVFNIQSKSTTLISPTSIRSPTSMNQQPSASNKAIKTNECDDSPKSVGFINSSPFVVKSTTPSTVLIPKSSSISNLLSSKSHESTGNAKLVTWNRLVAVHKDKMKRENLATWNRMLEQVEKNRSNTKDINNLLSVKPHRLLEPVSILLDYDVPAGGYTPYPDSSSELLSTKPSTSENTKMPLSTPDTEHRKNECIDQSEAYSDNKKNKEDEIFQMPNGSTNSVVNITSKTASIPKSFSIPDILSTKNHEIMGAAKLVTLNPLLKEDETERREKSVEPVTTSSLDYDVTPDEHTLAASNALPMLPTLQPNMLEDLTPSSSTQNSMLHDNVQIGRPDHRSIKKRLPNGILTSHPVFDIFTLGTADFEASAPFLALLLPPSSDGSNTQKVSETPFPLSNHRTLCLPFGINQFPLSPSDTLSSRYTDSSQTSPCSGTGNQAQSLVANSESSGSLADTSTVSSPNFSGIVRPQPLYPHQLKRNMEPGWEMNCQPPPCKVSPTPNPIPILPLNGIPNLGIPSQLAPLPIPPSSLFPNNYFSSFGS